MSERIFVESIELRDAAGRMDVIVSSMADIRNDIAQIQSGKSSIWQGRAANQNSQNFARMDNIIERYLNEALGTKNALDESVNTYEQTELEQNRKVSNLNVDGIF